MTTALGILAAISVCHCLNDLMQSVLPAVYPLLKASYNLDFGQIGLITFANQATASLLGVQIIGTRWAVFITYLTFALPFSTWVMVTYLRGLPKALEEAARIDGASSWRILTGIVVPLSWPGIVVSGIFAFLLGWNDVLFASVLTNPETRTAAVALQVFGATQEGGAVPLYGQMMAASLICAVPVVVLYLVFQRYLIGGLTSGGVK